MKFKYATVELPNGENRITFSREEILAMRNSLGNEPILANVNLKIFLREME